MNKEQAVKYLSFSGFSDEQIKAIEGAFSGWGKVCPSAGVDCEDCPAYEKKTKWIPVSERLPDKYTYTLWCASSGYVRSDYFNGEFWEDAKKYCYEVVAWMPLPEPYKKENN